MNLYKRSWMDVSEAVQIAAGPKMPWRRKGDA